MGLIGLAMSALLFFLLPPPKPAQQRDDWLKDAGSAFAVVFRNPQSILCGIIAGLLFIPTTIFDMTWGVRYLQEGRGLGLRQRRTALSVGSDGMDHRMPAPRLHLRPDRAAEAGHCGERADPVRVSRLDSLRACGRVPAVRPWPRRRGRLWGRDAAIHGDQGGEPAEDERHRHRCRQLSELHVQRACWDLSSLAFSSASAAARRR